MVFVGAESGIGRPSWMPALWIAYTRKKTRCGRTEGLFPISVHPTASPGASFIPSDARQSYAAKQPVSLSEILAHFMAHELGHIVLGQRSHEVTWVQFRVFPGALRFSMTWQREIGTHSRQALTQISGLTIHNDADAGAHK